MKKTLKLMVLLFALSIISISCKENKEEATSNSHSEEHMAADKADIAMNVYQCPMDCEDGKTYDAPGACPVCAMDLKKVEGKHQHEDGKVHDDHEKPHDEHEDDDSN